MGYYTIRLDPEKSKICTIIFPWGKLSYKRLPMDIAGSPNIHGRSCGRTSQCVACFTTSCIHIVTVTFQMLPSFYRSRTRLFCMSSFGSSKSCCFYLVRVAIGWDPHLCCRYCVSPVFPQKMGRLNGHCCPCHCWLAFCWRELTFRWYWTGHYLHNCFPFWWCNSHNFWFHSISGDEQKSASPRAQYCHHCPNCLCGIPNFLLPRLRISSWYHCCPFAFVIPCPMGRTYCWGRRRPFFAYDWTLLIEEGHRHLVNVDP